jgi:hypothetical protein
MYSSIILARCLLANSSPTNSERLEQQKHIVQLFTSMVSRIAVLDSSSEIGIGIMENAFALNSYAQVCSLIHVVFVSELIHPTAFAISGC